MVTGLVGTGPLGAGFGVWFPKQCPARTKPLQVVVGVGVGVGVGAVMAGLSRFQAVPPKSGVGKFSIGMGPNICCAYACQMLAGQSPP